MMNYLVYNLIWQMRSFSPKCILLLLLSISLGAQAQFKITTEKVDGDWRSSMNDSEWFDSSNATFWSVYYFDVNGGTYDVTMYILGSDQCRMVNRQCTELDDNGDRIAKDRPIVLELSNGERLSFIDKITNEDGDNVKDIHAFSLNLGLAFATSSLVDLEDIESKDVEYYIIRQLCNYDIIGISVLGQHFSFTKIRTSPTFNSMFSELSQKMRNSSRTSSNTGMSAKFNKTWLELNVFQDGIKGLRVHADFSINNAKGKKIKMDCFFFDSYGNPLVSLNDKFASGDGQVMAETYLVPKYDKTSFHDVTVFIPYSELHLTLGYHEIDVRTTIFYNGYQYAEDDGLGFSIGE